MSDARVSSRWVGGLAGVSAVLKSTDPFVLAGIEWTHPQTALIELRALSTGGRWSRWVNVSVQGHDSEGGRAPAHALFGDPVWTGPALAVQLRSSVAVEGLTVHLVAARRPAGRPADAAAGIASVAASALPLARPILDAGPGQPPIIARAVWAGTDHPPEFAPEYGDVRMAFVHHSAGANGYSAGEVPSILLAIYDFHRYTRGWYDIGYNFAIDAFGRIWEARAGGIDQAVVGAQAGGYNIESTGAVLLGNFSSVLPSQPALAALEQLLAWKLALHGVPVSGQVTVEVDPPDAYWTRFAPGQHVSLPRIAGHRQGCTTDCPGDALFAYLPKARTKVAKIVGKQLQLTLIADRQKPATYLRLASVHAHYNTPLELSGHLRTLKGVGVPGAEIQLQSLVGQTEAVVGTATTDADGNWSTQLPFKDGMLLRALHADTPATASALIGVAVAPVLTLTPELPAPGSAVVIGTVTPWKRTVTLTVHNANTGKLVLTREVGASRGSFRHTFSLKPGRYHVQASTLPDARNTAGHSALLTLSLTDALSNSL